MLLKRIKYLLWLWKVGRKKFPMKPLIDTTHDSVIDESYWTPDIKGEKRGKMQDLLTGSGGGNSHLLQQQWSLHQMMMSLWD